MTPVPLESASAQPSAGSFIRTALLVSLSAAIGLGFGRFAYALLLVPMRASLGLNYAQAGLLNSANALGYLVGALAVGPAVARWGAAQVVRFSLLLTSLSLIGTGLVPSFSALFALRALTGLGAGLIFISGAAVVMQVTPTRHSALPLGVYYSGPGIGIALSGLLVPLLGGLLQGSWRGIWVVMGCVGLLVAVLLELPLRAVGRTGRAAQAPAASGQRLFVPADYLLLWPMMVSYTLFGLGYIGYMTFVVAFLQSMHVPPATVQGFWVLLGVCAALCGFGWRLLNRRLALHHALALILTALTLGALLPVLFLQLWSFVLSAVLFGGSFLAVVTVITQQVQRSLPSVRWTTVMGNATALFGFGQLLGPTLTGLVADMQGGLALGLVGSAVLLAIATLIVLIGPRPAVLPHEPPLVPE